MFRNSRKVDEKVAMISYGNVERILTEQLRDTAQEGGAITNEQYEHLYNSFGAEFAPGLNTDAFEAVFVKGTDTEIDSYSGFFDNGHRKATGLGDYLKEKGVEEVYILGLALDVCVKFTVLDALGLGFKTYLVEDGCRGVNLNEGDSDKALSEMREKGAIIAQSDQIITS